MCCIGQKRVGTILSVNSADH